MKNYFVMTLLLFVSILGLSCWFFYQEIYTKNEISKQLELAQLQRTQAKIESIEVGLDEWLAMLELPQLADKKKRREVAHQLRIVLVEKLMNGPNVR